MMIIKHRKSFAGALEPGDMTHYEFVIVEQWDVYEVVVLNDGFFDKLTFLGHDLSFYRSHRGEQTNPWTIKAGERFLHLYLEQKEAEE